MGAAALSLIGVFLAAYLYLYKVGRIGSVMCGTGGCETVQFSPWSRFLGIEVSLIGLAGYLGLLALSLATVQGPLAGRRWPVRLLAILSGVGVAFAAYLTYLELFVIHAICRWCVGSAVIISGIFACALLGLRYSAEAPAAG
jgi:uncharacterized membrane protein